jgi:hypothetical protein
MANGCCWCAFWAIIKSTDWWGQVTHQSEHSGQINDLPKCILHKRIMEIIKAKTYKMAFIYIYIGCFTTCGHYCRRCDFLGFCDKKSSYKHVSEFGRLRSYGHFLIPVHALVWTALRNQLAGDNTQLAGLSFALHYFCHLIAALNIVISWLELSSTPHSTQTFMARRPSSITKLQWNIDGWCLPHDLFLPQLY